MLIALHMLGLQWGFIGAILCIAWGCAYPSSRRSQAAAVFGFSSYLFSLAMLAAAGPAVGLGYHATILVLAFTLTLLWVMYAWLVRLPRPMRLGMLAAGRLPASVPGAATAAAVHLAAIVLASRHLAVWFSLKDTLRGLDSRLLWAALAAAMISASLLQAAVLNGIGLLGTSRRVAERSGNTDAFQTNRIVASAAWVLPALLFRLISIGLSLGLGAAADPVSSRHFWDSLLTSCYQFLALRLLLGLILPSFMVALALQAAREGRTQQATQQFLPLSILVLISEALAAGMTVGLWGIAL